jgi:hypothetical protein
MKRLLLIAVACSIGISAFSQALARPLKSHLGPAKTASAVPVRDQQDFSIPPNPFTGNRAVTPEETVIGITYYDVWSNMLYGNRLYRYDDGHIVGVFTYGENYPNFSDDRGTGYNYFDGNAWQPVPTARIETVRTGWPSYAPWGTEGEIVVAHNANNLEITKRSTRYTGEWTETNFVGVEKPTWPKIASSGDENQYLHMIYNTYDPLTGYDGAFQIYSRSTDGGDTWVDENIILDGTGPQFYFDWGSEPNALATRGDVVAILFASAWNDMFVLKSYDNGDTWEKIMIWNHPYPFYDENVTVTDTMMTPDQTAAIALGPDNKVHVVFGITFLANFTPNDDLFDYFSGIDGIGYWNEDMPAFNPDITNTNALAPPWYTDIIGSELVENVTAIGWSQDVNENGTLDLLDDYFDYNPGLGLSSMPTITVDEEGRIFLVYASCTEGYDNLTNNYKKIWVRAFDNGEWGPFFHATADLIHFLDESINPMLAQTSDDNIYFMYQADATPGVAVGTAPDHGFQENRIIFSALPKSDVLTGIGDNKEPFAGSVTANYPNPFSEYTTVTVNLKKSARLSIEVTNLFGQRISYEDRGTVQAGSHLFRIDGTSLADGVYFYTVKADNGSMTQKMIVR